jgi:hypothetical protein
LLVNSRIEYKCAVESPSARISSIDRALRAVRHVGLKSTPTAFLYLIILVLPARAGGLIRAATALVTTRLVSR